MTLNIFFCGYSYHTNRYHSQYKSGYPSYLFRLQTEGLCEVVVKGRKMELEKGDLLLIKPGDHYELLVNEGQNSGDYHLGCEGAWIDEWWSRSEKPPVSRIDLDEKLLSIWRHIMIEKRRPLHSQNEELAGYLLRALCLTLERAVNETVPSSLHPYTVTRMMRYIEEHATYPLKVGDVARHAGLSVSRSVHLFKSSIGKTIMEYVQEIRLSAAIERMKYTTMTLEQIAVDCGFGTYPYFHKVFKKKYGMAPGAYRRIE
ncbi:helix-turn-helix domain-containing protein [Neobacillus massiliamazoniensis]|uniref:AraC family transcriptional regulator n=1 Tax=Neobacillus massiliamazoniensis TaxID=1499688 RepID=A0A0U1NW14_9BACI|nr:AraC family transcriptional regulator [Neobacillus massiliamazoniensis]CRK82018.1 AraC family transcriptional regulator [Neobacillus massiliamazoniensis]